MKIGFPKLKHALACRIVMYAAVVGGFVLPAVLLSLLGMSETAAIAVWFVCLAGVLIFFAVDGAAFIMTDMVLAGLHCAEKARTQYPVRGPERIAGRIARFGQVCDPAARNPEPELLRYRQCRSWTPAYRGVEKVAALYRTDYLDQERYRRIFRSAQSSSKALTGKKAPRFLIGAQKQAPLRRVTVAVILAKEVDPRLNTGLFDLVGSQIGNEYDDVILPCVVDLSRSCCVFESRRDPMYAFRYSAKNRGLDLIRRFVFGGWLPVSGNPHGIGWRDPEIDPEESLWEFRRKIRQSVNRATRSEKKRFSAMEHGQIQLDENVLYLRWEAHGIWLPVEFKDRAVTVGRINGWNYPRAEKMEKKTVRELERHIAGYFADQGKTALFKRPE